MTTVPTGVRWSGEQLLAAVQQLPARELRAFHRQFASWWEENNGGGRGATGTTDEGALLTLVRENSRLPPSQQRRFDRLRQKQQVGTLTTGEWKDLQALWRRVEQMNVTRLEALAELARRRGTDVPTLMRQLRLPENRDAV
jgi:hypothetical protein